MKVKNSFLINIFKCKIPTLAQFYLANIKVKTTSGKQPYIWENIVILHDRFIPSFSAIVFASLLFPEHILPSTVITLLSFVSFFVVLSPNMKAKGPYCFWPCTLVWIPPWKTQQQILQVSLSHPQGQFLRTGGLSEQIMHTMLNKNWTDESKAEWRESGEKKARKEIKNISLV